MDSNGNFIKFYDKALKFLSYRPRSEKEVRDRLELKIKNSKFKTTEQNSKILIDKIIDKLRDYKFIDDLEFARKFAEDRIKFKPRSLRLIKRELKQKGIGDEVINKMINDRGLRINDLENAKKLVEKRIVRLKNLQKQKIYEKLGRFLASKGFGWDTIKKAIDLSSIGVD